MASLLDTLQNAVKNLIPSGGGNSAVGIDIGASSIKIVQASRVGEKVQLDTYGELALGPYANAQEGDLANIPPEKIAEALKDIFAEAKVTAKRLAVSIRAAGSLIYVIELPKVSSGELDELVHNEARKYIPVPLTDVSLDWWQVPRPDEEKKMEVLIAAVHNDTISGYQDILKSAGMSSTNYEIETFSAIRSVFHHEPTPVLVVDFGAAGTRAAVVENGIVQTLRSINRGGHFITDALVKSLGLSFTVAEQLKKDVGLTNATADPTNGAKAQEIITVNYTYVFSELSAVLLEYEKKYGKAVGKVIAIGGGAGTVGLVEQLAQQVKAESVLGDPFFKTEAPEFLREALQSAGPEFSIAVGLALKNFS